MSEDFSSPHCTAKLVHLILQRFTYVIKDTHNTVISSKHTILSDDKHSDLLQKETHAIKIGFENYGGINVEKSEKQTILKQTSLFQLIINLTTSFLGAGIFSLPWGMAGASMIMTFIFFFLGLSTLWIVNMILVFAADELQVFNLGDLMGNLPGQLGKLAKPVFTIIIWVKQVLCLVGCIIVIADCLMPLMPPILAYRPIWILVSTCFVLPLCFLDQSALSWSSTISILANIFMFIAVVFEFKARGIASDICFLGLSPGSITLLSSFFMASSIQMIILPMYSELKDRSPTRFGKAMFISEIIVFVLFSAISSFAYLTFGSQTPPDIMASFSSAWLGTMCRLMMVISIICVYPLMLYPMISPIRDNERNRQALANPSEGSLLLPAQPENQTIPFGIMRTKYIIVAIVVTISLLCLFCSNLGVVNTYNGALSMLSLLALAPPLAGLYLMGKTSRCWKLFMYCITIVGVLISLCALTLDTNYADELLNNCVWKAAS